MRCPKCDNYLPGHATGGDDICTCPHDRSKTAPPRELAQLLQLKQAVWDGNLIDKQARDHLVRTGYAGRAAGWNFLTARGVETLVNLGFLKA